MQLVILPHIIIIEVIMMIKKLELIYQMQEKNNQIILQKMNLML